MIAENPPLEGDSNISEQDQVADSDHRLISSRRVEGTRVYDRQGEKLGTVHSVMIDKISGQVAYAVMSFGGFLGTGKLVYPIPWKMLTYDVSLDGYVVEISSEQLDKAPAFGLDEADRPRHQDYADEVYAYYFPGF